MPAHRRRLTTAVAVRLPEDLADRAAALAGRRYQTTAELIREALREKVEREEIAETVGSNGR